MKGADPGALLGDKAYDADSLIGTLAQRGITPVIPPKANRKVPRACDFALYCERNLIERFFNKLKNFRAIATRYDKLAKIFLAGVQLTFCYDHTQLKTGPKYICPMKTILKKISACPGWLDLSEDRRSFICVPGKAEIMRKIFELSIGGLGSYSIANHLNRQNVPAFGSSPKWDHTTIDSMLRNRATVGEYQPKSWAGGSKKGVPVGDPVSGYYPAVIDEATFRAAQVARRRNLAVGRGRKGENITNIFTGLTTCTYCASPVKFHSQGNSKSLICAQVLNSTGCVRTAWSYRNFERSVLHFLTHPALIESLKDEKRKTMLVELVRHVRNSSGADSYDARFGIASILKHAVSELKLASAGLNPTPTLPDALIRWDNPERCFEIKLWDGPTYVGIPMES